MTHIVPDQNIDLLAGTLNQQAQGGKPFSDLACSFLADLSSSLLRHKEGKARADIAAFAFWCRSAHIKKLQARFTDDHIRLGRGLAFHISPSNVPINAFYSLAFGLLSGNGNIVRLSSKHDKSVDIALSAINALFHKEKYAALASENAIIRYEHNKVVNDYFSAACSARIIWGGDASIKAIRQSPTKARCQEITFSDRYSFAVIDPNAIEALEDAAVTKLATAFFNDTMLLDQNACSSPHLVIWLGQNSCGQERFWRSVMTYTRQKHDMEPVQAVDRCIRLYSNFITGPEQRQRTALSDPLQRVTLGTLPGDVDQLRGVHGLFYEYEVTSLDKVAHIVNSKYQTLTYFGVPSHMLSTFVVENRLTGIDRIVPMGNALDIDVIWDGYDILKELTRIIDVR